MHGRNRGINFKRAEDNESSYIIKRLLYLVMVDLALTEGYPAICCAWPVITSYFEKRNSRRITLLSTNCQIEDSSGGGRSSRPT